MVLKTIRYLGPNLWNSLKNNTRLSQDLSSFKNLVLKIDFAGILHFPCRLIRYEGLVGKPTTVQS